MLLCAGLRLRLGRRRRQNSEGRSKAESYPLTPFARGLPGFCTEGRKPQDASQSCDNQDGWSPHCIKPPNLLVVGAPCALWTGVPGDSPKVTRERASDHQFSPSPAFLRWSHEAGHLALQWPWPRPFPGTECGEAAEGGSRAGAWPPWGSEGSRLRGPERGKAQFLPLRSGRSG